MKNALFLIFVLISFLACKQDQGSTAHDSGEETSADIRAQAKEDTGLETGSSSSEVSQEQINQWAASAAAVVDFRKREQGTTDYSFLVTGQWDYKFVASGSSIKPGSAMNGKWIKFLEGLKYEYGDADGKQGSGIYHFSLDTDLIILVDDKKNIKPQEYKVMTAGNAMVFQGKPTYSDNHIQMKLENESLK